MQVKDIAVIVRSLLDEYTNKGVVSPDSKVADLTPKIITFTNLGQQEIVKLSNLKKTFSKYFKPVRKMQGLPDGFETLEFYGGEYYFPSENGIVGALAYGIEVDGPCLLEYQENNNGTWITIASHAVDSTVTEFTRYKGLLALTNKNNAMRLKMTGQTYLKHQNRVFFDVPFLVDRIPDYAQWVKVPMPDDFLSVRQVIEENIPGAYAQVSGYRWEGFKDLYVNWFYEGEIRIHYSPIPKQILSIDDYLVVDDNTAGQIAYYVLANVAPHEMGELADVGWQKWAEFKAELYRGDPSPEVPIQDVYNMWG